MKRKRNEPDTTTGRPTNLAQDSGQMHDMMTSTSDDGTIPPTAEREEVTTGVNPRAARTAQQPYFVANPGKAPDVRTADQIGPDVQDGRDGKERIASRADKMLEVTDSNPVPLSPTDPRRRTDEGQPYLDDANPYGRVLPNRQNQQMGGVGIFEDPVKTERHVLDGGTVEKGNNE